MAFSNRISAIFMQNGNSSTESKLKMLPELRSMSLDMYSKYREANRHIKALSTLGDELNNSTSDGSDVNSQDDCRSQDPPIHRFNSSRVKHRFNELLACSDDDNDDTSGIPEVSSVSSSVYRKCHLCGRHCMREAVIQSKCTRRGQFPVAHSFTQNSTKLSKHITTTYVNMYIQSLVFSSSSRDKHISKQ